MFKRILEKMVQRKLANLRSGQLILDLADRQIRFGNEGSVPSVIIHVHNDRLFQRIAWGGDLGAAESYMDGDWDCDDLVNLFRIMIANLDTADALKRGSGRIRAKLLHLAQILRPNLQRRAKQNILQHYDLSNNFFANFLDPTLSYSSAIFADPQESLENASLRKLQLVCEKLQLSPAHHLLEIGTGWGSLAIFAAKNYGCRVTTTTVSDQQFRLAGERIRQFGLESQITLLNRDYRELKGTFDRIVSIEMIEAVGHRFLKHFFSCCNRLLDPSGLMLLQGIVIRDQRFEFHTKNIDFMRRYIFPGGCLPSVTALLHAMTEGSEMRMLHLEDIAAHYPPTLLSWLNAFDHNEPSIRELGFDERFLRMWRFYFCYCAAAFLERQVNNIQALFAGPLSRHDVTQFQWNLKDLAVRNLAARPCNDVDQNGRAAEIADSMHAFSTDSYPRFRPDSVSVSGEL
ncbi:MAG TPA: cyclopropane-fatty-acyl-phospholipid synthase family protein [Pirellulaceae bacterium]|mgnify:CR=1 FL=1|nr:cyclopropane-fatty-acyl-phospholipid synthase family protein [Pirellulaceae bacterium]HMO91685.1 cyclopropane-fatty-acyl-phospholipid synthase family protein [Pirellulaceae bacterium]HMP68382.1 cyclopropane-fatty-acyl-phospholipid synthase family protein [Pirellulaceae bacterium]